MKSQTGLGFALILFVFLLIPSTAWADSCSCRAPDGSCSASISCDGGCAAMCGIGGACTAQCVGGGNGDPKPLEPLLRAPAEGMDLYGTTLSREAAEQLVHLDVQDASDQDISEVLQDLTGLVVEFRTNDPADRLSLNASGIRVRDLLKLLASRGAVAIRGHRAPWQPPLEDALRETNVTLSVQKISPGRVVSMLADILGAPMTFEPTVEDAVITLDVKNAPVGEVLSLLRQYGTITGSALNETP